MTARAHRNLLILIVPALFSLLLWAADTDGAPPATQLTQAAPALPAAPQGAPASPQAPAVTAPAQAPPEKATGHPAPPPQPVTSGQAPRSPEAVQPSESAPVPANGPQPPGAGVPAMRQPPGAMARPALVPPRRGMVNLNFDDADVYTIIQTVFGDVLKVNYVVDPRVKGRVTFRSVAPIAAENVLPLMEVIFRLNGIGIIEEAGLYRIIPISEITKEPSPVGYGRDPAKILITGKAILQVVPVQYVSSTEIVKLIQPFASANAVLIDVPKGNQVIIADTDANVKRLLRLIEIFDNAQLKKRPQVFVYHVQNGKAKDIADLLQQIYTGGKGASPDRASARPSPGSTARPATGPAMGSYTATTTAPAATTAATAPAAASMSSTPHGGEALVSESTKIIPDEITNTILILSTPEEFEQIKNTIQRIDIIPRQVVIEGMVAAVNLKDNLSLGVAAMFKGHIGGLDVKFGLNPGALTATDPANLSQSGFTFVGTDGSGEVRALITALATDSKAKLLATPHILVSDNREAKIQVGQSVPLITSSTYGTPGVAPIQTVQYRDIGIILKVKPRVNEGGLVALEIYQEVSTYEKIILGVADQQLLINKTDATTSVVVQNNQTIVIGGLIREDKTKNLSGIPYLSRIPVIGWIFGSWDDTDNRQELIILLTPRVIKTAKDAEEISAGFVDNMAETSKGGIKRDELIRGQKPPAEGRDKITLPNPPEGK